MALIENSLREATLTAGCAPNIDRLLELILISDPADNRFKWFIAKINESSIRNQRLEEHQTLVARFSVAANQWLRENRTSPPNVLFDFFPIQLQFLRGNIGPGIDDASRARLVQLALQPEAGEMFNFLCWVKPTWEENLNALREL